MQNVISFHATDEGFKVKAVVVTVVVVVVVVVAVTAFPIFGTMLIKRGIKVSSYRTQMPKCLLF